MGARSQADAPRAWQRMLSGRRLDLLNPSPLDVEIEDIAHGLARVARWNGQTRGDHAFSVAQHSLARRSDRSHLDAKLDAAVAARKPSARCARICDRRHDQPVQGGGGARLQGVRKKPARRHPHPLRTAGGLPKWVEQHVKRSDKIAAYLEATQLAGFEIREAHRLFGVPRGLSGDGAGGLHSLKPLPPREAAAQYLRKFRQLQ